VGVGSGTELCAGHVGSRAADVTSPWLRLKVFAKAATATRQQTYRSLNWVSPHSFVTFLSEMYPIESGLGVSERRSGSGESVPLRAMKECGGVEV
jgi:hypothetical protein